MAVKRRSAGRIAEASSHFDGGFDRLPPAVDILLLINAFKKFVVPEVGVEPARPYGQGILSPQRLPFRHSGSSDHHHSGEPRAISDFGFRISDFPPSTPATGWKCTESTRYRKSGILVYCIHGNCKVGQKGTSFNSEGGPRSARDRGGDHSPGRGDGLTGRSSCVRPVCIRLKSTATPGSRSSWRRIGSTTISAENRKEAQGLVSAALRRRECPVLGAHTQSTGGRASCSGWPDADSASLCRPNTRSVEARRNILVKHPPQKRDLEAPDGGPDASARSRPEVLFRWAARHGLPENDAPILAAAAATEADLLVTGDRRHFGHLFGADVGGVRIVPSRDALRLASRS